LFFLSAEEGETDVSEAQNGIAPVDWDMKADENIQAI